MIDMNYFKRLGLHGGRLVWRVVLILAFACFGAVATIARMALGNSSPHEEDESPFEEYFNLPDIGDVGHADWQGLYGKDYKNIM